MQLQKLCDSMGISLIDVSSEQYEQQLGALAAIQGFKKKPIKLKHEPVFPAEMMVLSGFNAEEMDAFLTEYKARKIQPIGLKAVITPDNVFWTPKQLFNELMKEHLFFHGKRN